MTIRRREGLLWALAGVSPLATASASIPAGWVPAPLPCLSHYDYPPFVTAPGAGLSYDLARWLGQHLSRWISDMPVQVLPRRRLDRELSQPHWQGVVPWVSPVWFGDALMQRFAWSEPIMADADLVLSLKARPVPFSGPASLKGLRFGGVAGHHYEDLQAMIERGELKRDDAVDTGKNLRKLLMGRVDFVFLSRSGMPWWTKEFPEINTEVFVADTPRLTFQRRVLLSPFMPAELRHATQQELVALPTHPQWLDVLSRYGLAQMAGPSQRHR